MKIGNKIDNYLDKKKKEATTYNDRGRTTIDSMKRTSHFSKRAAEGDIDVIRKYCGHCGHHKAFSKFKGVFCTKCGRPHMKK